MIPTIEKVTDMNNHYPELDEFIAKLERRYTKICNIIDSSSLSNEIKLQRKNSYYIYLLVVKRLLTTINHRCFLLIRDDGVLIDNNKSLKLRYNLDLLRILFNNEEILAHEYFGDQSIIFKLTLQHEDRRRRTI